MLSVCIITKNEAKKLEKCLKHIKKYVKAEIVVVDTGSTDHTLDIIKEYADISGYFEWCDDFGRAKNYVASLATNDWILTIDSDEYIQKADQDELDKITNKYSDILGYFCRTDIYEVKDDKRSLSKYFPRLYNRTVYHYEGRIHEQLRRIDGQEIPASCDRKIAVYADHDGYMGDEAWRKEKAMRNKSLLLLDLEEFGEKPYTLFQLGKSCYMAGDYKEAAEYFSKGLEFDLDPEAEYVTDMVETYGYALLNSGQAELALGLESVYDTFAKTADFKFLMGLIYMNNGLLERAIEEFEKAAGTSDCKVEGTNSYRPYFNIGVIYECSGQIQQAKKYYKKCGNYDKARQRLKAL